MKVYVLFFGNRIVDVFTTHYSAEKKKIECILETFVHREDFGSILPDCSFTYHTKDGDNFWVSEHDMSPSVEGEVDDNFTTFAETEFPDMFAKFTERQKTMLLVKQKQEEEKQQAETSFQNYLREQEMQKKFELRRKNLDALMLSGQILRSEYVRNVNELNSEKERLKMN